MKVKIVLCEESLYSAYGQVEYYTLYVVLTTHDFEIFSII